MNKPTIEKMEARLKANQRYIGKLEKERRQYQLLTYAITGAALLVYATLALWGGS